MFSEGSPCCGVPTGIRKGELRDRFDNAEAGVRDQLEVGLLEVRVNRRSTIDGAPSSLQLCFHCGSSITCLRSVLATATRYRAADTRLTCRGGRGWDSAAQDSK